MKISLPFLRVFFVFLSVFFMTAFMATLPIGPMWQKMFIGLGVGLAFSSLLFSLEVLFKRYNLKAFNTLILGLFTGYLLGKALIVLFNGVLAMSHLGIILQTQTIDLMRVSFLLLGTYLGAFLTLHFSNEIVISIPFVNLVKSPHCKRDILIDTTALADSRILDLAATGLVDNCLVMPRFIEKELYSQAEFGDESSKTKARTAIDTLKKLQTLPQLALRFNEIEYPTSQDSFAQLARLARLTDSNILAADLSQLQLPAVEGIKIINLNSLSNALKPLMDSGETMKIKIQRFGKEPNQGVGYLEDGTMVVVNGGGDFIGECIDVFVLSVKHTSSGRMIFCNTMEDAPMKGNRVEV